MTEYPTAKFGDFSFSRFDVILSCGQTDTLRITEGTKHLTPATIIGVSTNSVISQPLYQVWTLFDNPFSTYAADKQTNRQTEGAECPTHADRHSRHGWWVDCRHQLNDEERVASLTTDSVRCVCFNEVCDVRCSSSNSAYFLHNADSFSSVDSMLCRVFITCSTTTTTQQSMCSLWIPFGSFCSCLAAICCLVLRRHSVCGRHTPHTGGHAAAS